jgi:type IV pilus assembly protein PilO
VERRDRNILLLGLLVILLLVVGYYFLLLGPLLNNLDERAQERSDKEAQLANLQQDVAQLEQVRRNAPELERQLLEYSKRIPEEPEIPTLVVQIEEIARASGVTQLSIVPGSPGSPPGGGNYSVLPITMAFEGTYEELQEFTRRTDNLVRLVTINDVTYCRVPVLDPEHSCTIEADEAAAETTVDQGVEALLQVQLEADVYFQPSDVPAGAAPVAPVIPETTPGAQEEAPGEATGAR